MRSASVAGPAGRVVVSPKNSSSTPSPMMSRSESRHTTWLALSARRTSPAAVGPRGTMFMPSWRRKSLKNSNSAGGSTGSTTTVTGMPITRVSQKPAHSHPPRWGRATIVPRPAAADSVTWWKPSTPKWRSTSATGSAGQPERVDPVAGVAVEGGVDGAVEGPALELGTGPAQVAGDQHAALGRHRGRGPAQRLGGEVGHRPRHGAGVGRRAAIGGGDEIEAHPAPSADDGPGGSGARPSRRSRPTAPRADGPPAGW